MNLCSRFYHDTSGNVVVLNTSAEVPLTDYDDIVDRSTFRPNAESVRQSVQSGSGFIEKGIFDDPDNLPSDVAVMVRSGKLDRAEIDDYLRQQAQVANEVADDEISKASKKKQKEISDARQAHLDKSVGFVPGGVSS